jgi:hypothetical protein
MEALLIDVAALAAFLGYLAIVYWHGVSDETRPLQRPFVDAAVRSYDAG